MRKMCLFLAMSLITAFLLSNPLVSLANVRVEWEPGIGYGGPFYAYFYESIEGVQMIIHTDEWAAIPFYRDPDCVPEDFNLLDLYDFEKALDCYSLVEGFEIWENGPGLDPAPLQVSLKAAGPMHIHFVPWPVLQDAIEDDELTMPELNSLAGVRIGIATSFSITHHPGLVDLDELYTITAKGSIEADNGDKFELSATCAQYKWTHVKTDFKPAKSAPALRIQSKLAVTWGEMKGEN